MSLASLPVRILATLPFVSVASCQPAEPREQDARAIYGCYVAKGAPSFFLGSSGMRVAGAVAPIPFRYVRAKVGYGIEVPLDAIRLDRRLSFVPSTEDYFYRKTALSDPPVLVVGFGRGPAVNYSLSESARCAV